MNINRAAIRLRAESEALRHQLAQEALKQGAEEGSLHVEYERAQQAFSGWTYLQIRAWGARNCLTVEFLAAGALRLRVFR